jgi:solute carrier family 6 amino acid transporter-like protein 5/7/9/14
VGIGQTLCIMVVATYYSSIMAITMRYLVDSFSAVLPWSECNPMWNVSCYPSSGSMKGSNITWTNDTKSSAELYFLKDVLHAKETIDDGIGMPNWNLVFFLVLSWTLVFLILFKGIKHSGKAAYVTGIAPFVFLVIFLIRALTLPGAFKGIAYFFTPKWEDILTPKVWFNACTQVFFTLNVFFVNVIMYASYNKFEHNIHRDSNIVTTLDTFTSILVGSITFGIVGHLSHELDKPIEKVFRGGPGLVFVTYPETIAKFKVLPQLFSVMFFLMLYILALGSLLAITSSAITVIRDRFKKVKDWQAALGFAVYGCIFGSLYTTPVSYI